MTLIKAVFPGAVLAWIVAAVLGAVGERNGLLMITRVNFQGHEFFWSWPIFVVGTALAWFILTLMRD